MEKFPYYGRELGGRNRLRISTTYIYTCPSVRDDLASDVSHVQSQNGEKGCAAEGGRKRFLSLPVFPEGNMEIEGGECKGSEENFI